MENGQRHQGQSSNRGRPGEWATREADAECSGRIEEHAGENLAMGCLKSSADETKERHSRR